MSDLVEQLLEAADDASSGKERALLKKAARTLEDLFRELSTLQADHRTVTAAIGVDTIAAVPDLVKRLRKENKTLRRLDSEAATHVESVICTRTGFTGNPPYVGWKGLGLALREALDERDQLRAEAEVNAPVGWLYHNPDTGLEWSEQHPVESGETPDAEDVREATATELHRQMIMDWDELEQAAAGLKRALSNATTND